MNKLTQWTELGGWKPILVDASSQLAAKLSAFLPQLVTAIAILLIGYLVARGVEMLTARVLRTLGLDRAAARLQLEGLLQRAEIRLTAAQIAARAAFWFVLLTAFLSVVETLELTAVNATIDRLISYIPNLVAAGLIALLGVLAAKIVGGLVRSAALAADLQEAARLGLAVQWTLVVFVCAVALEQLGVATEILVAPLTAVLGAITLSAGLAFALGARPIVTHILAGHFLRRSLPRERLVVVDGAEGLVERIGATETTLRSDSGSCSVPNARLMEDIVRWN